MPLKVGTPLCGLDDATGWLNVEQGSFAPPEGKPLLLHFWAMSCPACHANMPHLKTLRDRYAEHGLQVVAVHRPRGPFDLDQDRLRETMSKLGVTEPCALDNEHTLGDRFEVSAWPTYYLFDGEHKLRRHAMGGFGVRMMQPALERLFDEPGT